MVVCACLSSFTTNLCVLQLSHGIKRVTLWCGNYITEAKIK